MRGRETGKTEADGKKGSQQNKNLSEELKQGYLGTDQVNNAGRGTPINSNNKYFCDSGAIKPRRNEEVQ